MDGETTPHSDARANLPTDDEEDEKGVWVLGHHRDFTKMVSIKVQDKTFCIHEHVLERDSGHLSDMLSLIRDKSNSITLAHDIHPDTVADYLRLLQQSTYYYGYRFPVDEESYPLVNLLALWQLTQHFDDLESREVVEESLHEQHWATMSVGGWRTFYLRASDAELKERILHLHEAYEFCKRTDNEWEKEVIEACANCPPQVFAEVFAGLELGAEFRTEVMKSFALRHADPELTKKKMAEEKSSKKSAEDVIRVEVTVLDLGSPL